MRYIIDDNVCKDEGLDMPLLLTILLLNTGTDYHQNIQTLLDREIIEEGNVREPKIYMIKNSWLDKIQVILFDSKVDDLQKSNDRLEKLALELISIFPEGKKEGTNTYWRGNAKDIKVRLKKFLRKYGESYTDEQIISAARRYVASFNGNYAYMRILKYFIWKDERKLDSEGKIYTEELSDLATFIENEGQSDLSDNWMNEIR